MADSTTASQKADQAPEFNERSYKYVIIPPSDRAQDFKHIEAFGFFADPDANKHDDIEKACILYKWEMIPAEKGKFLPQTETRYEEMLQKYRKCYGGFDEVMRAPNGLLAAMEKKEKARAAREENKRMVEAENKKRAEGEQAG